MKYLLCFPVIAACCFSLVAGCDHRSASPSGASSTPVSPTAEHDRNAGSSTAGPAAVGHPEAPTPSGATARGTVRETMNAGGYTYMRIETPGGGSSWAATMEMPLAVGDAVQVEGGNEMVDFRSRALDRVFHQITFASGVRVVGRGSGQSAAAVAPGAAAGELPPGHPPMGAGAATVGAGAMPQAAEAGAGVRGVVRETMNAASYTYIRIEGRSGSVWVAVPQMVVAVGDQIEASAGNEMPGFHSRTLNRTFEQITFSPGAHVLGAAGARRAPVQASPAVQVPAHAVGVPGGHARALPSGHPQL